MNKIIIFFMLGFTILNSCAYTLPQFYNTGDHPLKVRKQKDGTYKIYYQITFSNSMFIYQTQPADLQTIGSSVCNTSSYLETIYFSYINFTKYPGAVVFINNIIPEASFIYPHTYYVCQNKYNLFVTSDYDNEPNFVIIQPIFKSQAKVWILIPRTYGTTFPGEGSADSIRTRFLANGDLYLVVSTEMDSDIKKFGVLHPKITETIPIDYSLFEKPVKKPTCYLMPENHKLRPCTTEEAKLRTPALKVFLGEATANEALKESQKENDAKHAGEKSLLQQILDDEL